ncbi:MAG: T9SS type A sorting domain-containing protein [Candidatus Hydrothermia bacterium]
MNFLLVLAFLGSMGKAEKAFLGDTIRFSIGNAQIVAVIQDIRGDTLIVDGSISTNNVFNIRVDDLKLSVQAFLNGQVQVYGYGNIFADGGNIDLNGVIIRNVRLSLTSHGFSGYGDVLFGDRNVTLYLYIDTLNNVAASFYANQFQVYGVTLNNFTLNIYNGLIDGGTDVAILGNTFHLNLGYDGTELYAEARDLNFTYQELILENFYLRVGSSTGFIARGRMQIYDSYADLEMVVNSNGYLSINNGYFVVGGVEVRNFTGFISSSRYEIRGRVRIYDTWLDVYVFYNDRLSEPEFQLGVSSPEIIVGSVRIYNLNLTVTTTGISGYGFVKFNNVSNPPSGNVKVNFYTDRSGKIFIGISDGYVVLSNGGVISNLTAYVNNEGFFGYGTYRQNGNDITVVFESQNGVVNWQIYGDAIMFGGILLRHYYVGSDGIARAWWIISETDSLYFEFNWQGRYATTYYPGPFYYGNVMIYNLQGTIYADSGFVGVGYARIGDQNNYVVIPIQFRSNPNGKLFGKLPNYIDLPDNQGIVVHIYDIEVVITEEGITGYGQVNLENVSFYIEFVANYNGYINGSVRDGYINLGRVFIKDLELNLYPFNLAGWIYVPEFNGGIYVILKANGSGGLSLYVPGFDFWVNGFHIYGNFYYVNGVLFFQGGVEIPGGGAGSVDYLYVSSGGIDSCSITFQNININGFRIVYANGRFESNPGRIILSGNFDLSALSGFIGVNNIYFQNLQISPDGRFLGCELVGVNNFHIGDFFAFSGEFGFYNEYLVVYFAQIDFSNLSNVNGRLTVHYLVISYSGNIISASAIGIEYLNVGTFHASGWIYFLGNGVVSLTGEVSLDNIGYAYVRDLVINAQGDIISLGEGGCSFTIGGYSFSGRITFPASNRIYFEGSIDLPVFLSGEASGSILLERVADGQGVMGLGYRVLAGSLSIPEFMMGGYRFLGGSFAFDSVGVSGTARINVPDVCEVEMRLSFNWDGTFNYCYLAATGMNIPIGTTGLFLNGVGGGVYHYTNPEEYWMFVIWGLVSDPVRVLALDATLEIGTNGQVSGLGHLMIAYYTWATAGFDVYTRQGYLDAYGWLGEDPNEGISFWGCYIRGQDSVYYNWVNVDAWGRGNLSISVWFVNLDAWFGFAYSLPSYPFVYGPYWRQRLYNDGIGASGLAFGYLAGINVVWNQVRHRFDYDVWWGPVDQMNPGNAPFVQDVVFVGPYPGSDLEFDYLGGEAYVRPYDSYEAPGGFVWSDVNSDNTGYFNFNNFGNQGVVYAGLYIHSDGPRTAYLRYGISGNYKLFVNGQVVTSGVSSYSQPDQYVLPISFDASGWKFVMFKVVKAYDQWGLYLRVTDANGNIADGISYQPNRPDAIIVYHDRGLSFDPFRFERLNSVQIEGGKFVLRSDGRSLWQTYLKDRVHYQRINFPSFKVNFMLDGVARNDTTLVIMCDETRTRYYGVIFYYPSKGEELVGEVVGDGIKTDVKTSFEIGRWYTLEFVFEPESLYLYTYNFGKTRPIRPLFYWKLDDNWDPAFFASVGGSDNVLYLDNYTVRHDWQTATLDIETPHPYPNNAVLNWTVERPGASFIRLHFENFSTDYFDTLYIKDKLGRTWFTYNGPSRGSFSTPLIPSDILYLEFHSDNIQNDYGFRVDYVRYKLDVPYFYSMPLDIETQHPLPNNYDYTYEISIPDAKAIKICFNNFNMDVGDSISGDSVILYDASGNRYASYTGNLGTFFALSIPGNVVRVRVKTNNDNLRSYGFSIKYASYVTNDYYGVNEGYYTVNSPSRISTLTCGGILKVPLMGKAEGSVDVNIYDASGRRVYTRTFYVNRDVSALEIRLEEIPKGIYFLKVESKGKNILSDKFIKVK